MAFAGTRDEAETQLLERSIRAAAHACVAGRPTDALAGLDHDFLLTFPNSPTQDYAGMVRDYGNLCKRSGENTLESSVPVFEEVAVNGDIGIARLQWSTHLRGAPKESVRRLGELQVWRRTPDGWRLWRSARWPLRAPASR
ncbi:nuclear transport factor 2 family protein [Sphingomonas sp. URHD0057]|uniref:nuclear transport factor 2 family protein n=1 Tax=Sphingomonas sp. URHD0057 TaxID=1380389 RepID=UPI00048E4177